ncbi:MAG: helix-turn-helix domain-containing protein [Sphingobacteriia bacterium]|nr:helix-turn-helix domain-containing protein [Sphingobacteriia bacterium]
MNFYRKESNIKDYHACLKALKAETKSKLAFTPLNKNLPNTIEALIDSEELAKILGIKKNTLSIWKCTKRYNLPVVKVGRLVRYRLADVEKFIQDNTHQLSNNGESNEY